MAMRLLAFVGVVYAARHDYADTSVRIVGGKLANAEKYAAYGIPLGNVICGATLIAPDVMVSAAHCQGAFMSGPSSVALGGTTLHSTNAKEIIGVKYSVPHPFYDETTASNDIMLVVLAQPAHTSPVKLNTNAQYPIDGQLVTAIGFGNTAEGGHVSQHLQEVSTNIVSPSICSSTYGQIGLNVDNETMMCTGVYGGGKGTCQGDSGGPIFDQDGVLVGLVSWGKGCASASYPGVNSRISYFVSFLEEAICTLSNHPPEYCLGPTTEEKSESYFGNLTRPEGGWQGDLPFAYNHNESSANSAWSNISRPLIVTNSFGAGATFAANNSFAANSAFAGSSNNTIASEAVDFVGNETQRSPTSNETVSLPVLGNNETNNFNVDGTLRSPTSNDTASPVANETVVASSLWLNNATSKSSGNSTGSSLENLDVNSTNITEVGGLGTPINGSSLLDDGLTSDDRQEAHLDKNALQNGNNATQNQEEQTKEGNSLNSTDGVYVRMNDTETTNTSTNAAVEELNSTQSEAPSATPSTQSTSIYPTYITPKGSYGVPELKSNSQNALTQLSWYLAALAAVILTWP